VRSRYSSIGDDLSELRLPSVPETTTEQKVSIIKDLIRLSCTLAHKGSPACSRLKGKVDMVMVYSDVVTKMLLSVETPIIRMAGYDAVRSAIQHQPVDCDHDALDTVTTMLGQGLLARDRGVRISAG